MTLPNHAAFMNRYNISKETWEKSGLNWDSLLSIYTNHCKELHSLSATASYVSQQLQAVPAVHSVRHRVKDPEHLVEKIIRKMAEGRETPITPENYSEEVTDLIGIRALHLFKENWKDIHQFISQEWDLHEDPIANIRRGDSEDMIESFKNEGLRIREHKFGYRSVHYIIRSQPSRRICLAEVQVRTIFEEGWSEIDHTVRYPYFQKDAIISGLSANLNRLAGGADELGSFIRSMLEELRGRKEITERKEAEAAEAMEELRREISTLKVDRQESERLVSALDEVKRTAMHQSSLQAARDREHSMDWMLTEHKRQHGLGLSVVMGSRYGSSKLPSNVSPGSAVSIEKQKGDDALDVYNDTGECLGRLQNNSPLSYSDFSAAFSGCFGESNVAAMVVDVRLKDGVGLDDGVSGWLRVRVTSFPIRNAGSDRRRAQGTGPSENKPSKRQRRLRVPE